MPPDKKRDETDKKAKQLKNDNNNTNTRLYYISHVTLQAKLYYTFKNNLRIQKLQYTTEGFILKH